MATARKFGPQDMPPPGGFAPIQTERIKLRTVIGYKTGIAAFVISNALGWAWYSMDFRRVRRNLVEMRSARFVLQAVLLAERDREYLKQLRKNRDEETELMKDYPGWVVGTYFGEPVFENAKPDTFIDPDHTEFAIHAPSKGSYWIRYHHRHFT